MDWPSEKNWEREKEKEEIHGEQSQLQAEMMMKENENANEMKKNENENKKEECGDKELHDGLERQIPAFKKLQYAVDCGLRMREAVEELWKPNALNVIATFLDCDEKSRNAFILRRKRNE